MYDIRLKETEVSLLRGVPEHLKAGFRWAKRYETMSFLFSEYPEVVLHEEMFMNSLLSLRIWDHWSHEDDPWLCKSGY